MERGAYRAELRVAPRLLADPGPGAGADRSAAQAGLGHDSAPPPGRRARRPAGGADRRPRARRAAEDDEDDDDPPSNGNGNGNGDGDEDAAWTAEGFDVAVAHVADRGRESSEDGRASPDPGARRRYRFKHPTASGKTIAAAGFVEAARTTGVLILTHRRLLVDQFTRDLTKEGYGGRHPRAGAARRTRRPRTPPLTINTYSWFIKHADQHEATTSTAWSSATRRTRRWATRPRPPSGASQRAGLHRHDGHRPAAAEARRRRVPGRGGRLPAGRGGAPRAWSRRCAARGCARSRRCARSRSSAATSTRASWPPPSTSTRSTWPRPTSTRAGSATRRASSTRPASTTPSGWRRR